jgi:catechol 2,3-dioxygenase
MINIIYNLFVPSAMVEKGSVDCARLRVPDLKRAVRFYTETLGLAERSRSAGVSRLAASTQRGTRSTLVLREGQRELDRVTVGVSETALRDLESRLIGRGTDFSWTETDPDRGQAQTVTLPSGLPVAVRGRDPEQTQEQGSVPAAAAHAPCGLDHVAVASADVKADAEFLRTELGFRVADISMAGPGIWGRAFARRGDETHDVALLLEPLASSTRLHHVAWRAASVDHVTGLTERVRTAGFEVDIDMQRGVDGTRAAVYVRDPAGHRLEFATEPTGRTPAAPISLAQADPDDIDALWPETQPRRPG